MGSVGARTALVLVEPSATYGDCRARTGCLRILIIGGTGPSGIPIVHRLVDHGHDVNDPAPRPSRAPGDPGRRRPHPRRPLRRDVVGPGAGRHLVGCDRRHVRPLAHDRPLTTKGLVRPLRVGRRRARLSGLDRRLAARPARLPVPVREDADLVEDPTIDEKGYRIVRTEEAVFEAHPGATHFRYPYLYGPYQPVPREWSVVRRILDGRRRIIVADEGLTLHHHCYTENVRGGSGTWHRAARAVVGHGVQRGRRRGAHRAPDGRAVRAGARRRPRDRVDALRPGRAGMAAAGPAAAHPPGARPDPPAPPARPSRRGAGPRGGGPDGALAGRAPARARRASRSRCSPTRSTTPPRTR